MARIFIPSYASPKGCTMDNIDYINFTAEELCARGRRRQPR